MICISICRQKFINSNEFIYSHPEVSNRNWIHGPHYNRQIPQFQTLLQRDRAELFALALGSWPLSSAILGFPRSDILILNL